MEINFKQLREDRGVTQKEISDKTGLTRATLSRLENGQTEPSLVTTMKYLDALGLQLKIEGKR